jgi:hypothetical protein
MAGERITGNVSGAAAQASGGLPSRDRIVAGPGFNRWLVPPAALAIHLGIGMAYGFSVFWLPMARQLPGADAAACAGQGFLAEMVTTSCGWSVPALTHVFETFIAVLGIPAAIGVISMASPMLQDVFGARLVGVEAATAINAGHRAAIVAAAAGLVGLISLFNSVGRIFWASLSDRLGRRTPEELAHERSPHHEVAAPRADRSVSGAGSLGSPWAFRSRSGSRSRRKEPLDCSSRWEPAG